MRNTKNTVAFHTLGCKVNKYETDAVMQEYIRAGFNVKNFREKCDVYVINTCTVTNEADRKSRQFIRRAKSLNPEAVIVAMGCFVELEEKKETADIYIGNRNKKDAAEITLKYLEKKFQGEKQDDNIFSSHLLKNISDEMHEFEDMGYVTSREEARAYIKIEDGCNNYCSYCAIPYARGRVRSRPEESILEEAKRIAGNGFREVVFTGIHVCSFTTPKNKTSNAVVELAGKIAGIKGIERIRLGSLEPYSITDEFIEMLARIPEICHHFHISLQSGSDIILKKMNRKYTTDDYRRVLSSIRKKIPDATFTTDIIAGFPGEDENEHEKTLRFCREMDFIDIHVFKFSRRKGTKAEKMKGQTDQETIAKRSKELLETAKSMRIENYARRKGSTGKLLAERKDGDYILGYTEHYFPVKAADEKNIPENDIKGKIFDIKITGYNEDGLLGKII